MPISSERRSVLDAAEQAAAAGDYASAEELLRDAARIQEFDDGPLHPDLANTLNNLGIVCEITHKPADAELCYRQAYAIATAVLAPDHPFTVTSRKNLKDFCEAHGLPLEPQAVPAATVEQVPQVVSSVQPDSEPVHVPSRRFALGGLSSPLAIGALSLCGLMLVAMIAMSPWFRSNKQADSSPVGLTPARAEASTPTRDPGDLIDGSREARDGQASTTSATSLTLASATLCKGLSNGGQAGGWRCDPAGRLVESGTLFFYTSLKSPNDTTVQHRWYRDDLLFRSVNLRIGANPTRGYRTYSRYTMTEKSAGNWRVELRSKDGVLLHEERFVVR